LLFACRERGHPALRGNRAVGAAHQCDHRSRRAYSRRPGRGRGPRARRQAVPPHRKRHLLDYAIHDRQARPMTGTEASVDMAATAKAPASKILAVVSEVYPLVKTGGLADVAGALPRALRKLGVEVVTLVPGYPVVK